MRCFFSYSGTKNIIITQTCIFSECNPGPFTGGGLRLIGTGLHCDLRFKVMVVVPCVGMGGEIEAYHLPPEVFSHVLGWLDGDILQLVTLQLVRCYCEILIHTMGCFYLGAGS